MPRARARRAAQAPWPLRAALAKIGALRRIEREGDFEPVRIEEIARAFRPFDQGQRAFGRLLPAEVEKLVGLADPIEIGMDDRIGRRRHRSASA